MSTSIHDGIREFADSLYGTDDDPVGNGVARDGVANGVMHCLDSMGQHRVNWHPIASGVANGQDTYATIATPDGTGEWHQFDGQPFGTWPLTMRADGSPYRLIVRAGGAMSSAPSGETATIRVVIAPTLSEAAVIRDQSVDYVWEATLNSTSVAWLSGTTNGSDADATIMTVPASVARTWIARTATYDAVSSASPISVQQCLVSAWVFGRCDDDVERLPRLHALHLHEYIGT